LLVHVAKLGRSQRPVFWARNYEILPHTVEESRWPLDCTFGLSFGTPDYYKVDHEDEFQIDAESEKGGSGLLQTGKVVTRIHLTIIINLSWFIAIVTMWHSNNGPS
jgi:hypothetical protein